MGQLRHSPDLAPKDFFSFSHIKKVLRGCQRDFRQTPIFVKLALSSHYKQRQNVLSTIMLKYIKLSNENVRLQLATSEICQARNLASNPSNCSLRKLKICKNAKILSDLIFLCKFSTKLEMLILTLMLPKCFTQNKNILD